MVFLLKNYLLIELDPIEYNGQISIVCATPDGVTVTFKTRRVARVGDVYEFLTLDGVLTVFPAKDCVILVAPPEVLEDESGAKVT